MTRKDIVQTGLFFLAMGVSFPPIFMFHTEVNKPAILVIKFLLVPIVILCIWFLAIRPKQRADVKSLVIGIPVITFFILLLSYGYLLGLNHLFQKGTTVITGEIVDLYSSTGSKSGTSYYVEIYDEELKKIRKFDVSRSEYKKLNVGSVYESKWKLGLFNLVYK